MSDENRELISGPGRILAAARQEMGLDIKQVAVELHLRPSIVTAMEEEDYSLLPGTIFLKGYIRSYCRLVNLHEERLIEILEAQLKTAEDQIRAEKRESKRSRKTKRRVFTFLIVGALIIAAILGYEIYGVADSEGEQGSAEKMQQNAPETNKTESSLSDPSTLQKNKASQDTNAAISSDRVSAESNPEPKLKPELKPEPGTPATGVESQPVSKAKVAVAPVSSEQKVVSDSDEIKPVDQSVVPNIDRVNVKFSDDCWFKMSDSTGKTVVAGLKRAGDEVNYEGNGPFKVVLGNARAATVIFNGKDFDLNKIRSYKGRVEFSLKN